MPPLTTSEELRGPRLSDRRGTLRHLAKRETLPPVAVKHYNPELAHPRTIVRTVQTIKPHGSPLQSYRINA